MIFDIDYELLTYRILPEERKNAEKLKAFLRALRKPIEELYASNLVFRANILNQISYNNQTILFEDALNDRFDPIERRIRIDNTVDNLERQHIFYRAEEERQTFIFYRSEGGPKTYLRYREEFVEDFEFIVRVPGVLNLDVNEIKALVNIYNLAGKRYKVVFF